MAKKRRRSRGFAGSPEEHAGRADKAYASAIRAAQMAEASLFNGQCSAALISYGLAQKAMGAGDEGRKWGAVDAEGHENAQYAVSDLEGWINRKCIVRK